MDMVMLSYATNFVLLIILVVLIVRLARFHVDKQHQIETIGLIQRQLDSERERFETDQKKLQSENSTLIAKYQHDIGLWKKYGEKLKSEIAVLGEWKMVGDARSQAEQILKEASDAQLQAIEAANQLIEAARLEAANNIADAAARLQQAEENATSLIAEARIQVKSIRTSAQAALDEAVTKSSTIVAEAQIKAEEVAGAALKAMQNAELYEKTARAMKNIIDGYGDLYIVPAHSLLDDLADDFGHTEAGKMLKTARQVTKSMMKNDTAGTCLYVEQNRRETAINFVVDAFNGKVDSILSRVKNDNIGTLTQEMQDAFNLVNFNGKAFRDARITDEFLAARLEELRWAVIVQELRIQERDEQRRIKEQIREEEKARREIERTLRETAKQEDSLKKAMEKAQAQIAVATAEQKAQYEALLADLTLKLQAAEDRNRRALSMAQQTKRGHVYIISNIGSFGEEVFKIGLTRRLEPKDRIRELGDSSVPFEFDVHALIWAEDAPALENRLHKHFVDSQVNKVNHRKEFFRVDVHRIREEVEKLGLQTHWTMTSEAREYRESLAIERAIKDDPKKYEAWRNRQLQLDPVNAFDMIDDESDVDE